MQVWLAILEAWLIGWKDDCWLPYGNVSELPFELGWQLLRPGWLPLRSRSPSWITTSKNTYHSPRKVNRPCD